MSGAGRSLTDRCGDAGGLGLGGLGLDGGDGDGIDDVFDGAAPAEVVDGFAQTLQHGTDRDRPSFSLDGLIGIVAGIQIGEDQHRRLACHR